MQFVRLRAVAAASRTKRFLSPRLFRFLSGANPVGAFRNVPGLQNTFEVFTRVRPDNSLECLTERSLGLVTHRPSDVYELLVTLL